MDYIKEKEIKDHPQSFPIEAFETFLDQSKKSVCKIKCKEGGNGTGFFCKIPLKDKWNYLRVLMTCNHVLDKQLINKGETINFSLDNDKVNISIIIDDSRKCYTNETYDITIIEIKQNDDLDIEFLEVDKKGNIEDYKQKSIYLIQYPHGKRVEYSNGVIKNINEDNYTIEHYCSSKPGSSGGPIINLITFKVIGIHKGSAKKLWNVGTLIWPFIETFWEEINNNNNKVVVYQNIPIKMIKQEKNDINQKESNIINIINDTIIITYKVDKKIDMHNKLRIFGNAFVYNNNSILKMKVNGKYYELNTFFYFEKIDKGIFRVELEGISKIKNLSQMFYKCEELISLDITKWDTSKIINMSFLFSNCSSLKSLPDISKWNINNVVDMSYIFENCSSLKSIPDISKWNTSNISNMSSIFANCSSLK